MKNIEIIRDKVETAKAMSRERDNIPQNIILHVLHPIFKELGWDEKYPSFKKIQSSKENEEVQLVFYKGEPKIVLVATDAQADQFQAREASKWSQLAKDHGATWVVVGNNRYLDLFHAETFDHPENYPIDFLNDPDAPSKVLSCSPTNLIPDEGEIESIVRASIMSSKGIQTICGLMNDYRTFEAGVVQECLNRIFERSPISASQDMDLKAKSRISNMKIQPKRTRITISCLRRNGFIKTGGHFKIVDFPNMTLRVDEHLYTSQDGKKFPSPDSWFKYLRKTSSVKGTLFRNVAYEGRILNEIKAIYTQGSVLDLEADTEEDENEIDLEGIAGYIAELRKKFFSHGTLIGIREHDEYTCQATNKENMVSYEGETITILEWLENIEIPFQDTDIIIGNKRYVDMLEKCTDYHA